MTGPLRRRTEKGVAAFTVATFFSALVISIVGTGVVMARSRSPLADPPAVAGETSAITAQAPPPPGAPVGSPLRIRIPAIGVAATLVPLGLNPDGTLEVPSFTEAGWYTGASRPGDSGPAVIAAHVDSWTGPAVFYRLKEVGPGALIQVDYSDATVTFAVTRSGSFAKSAFPTAEVYGPTTGRELRLVTCGGSFDRKARSYRSNVVVWATAVGGQ